jgi:hypothetical protein
MSAPETTPNSCTCGSCACESAWQPIETALPGTVVLLWNEQWSGLHIGYRVYGDWLNYDTGIIFGAKPTHWQALPQPPTT